jgi:TfoX/Sxy family transcriptional regulator of competence genes
MFGGIAFMIKKKVCVGVIKDSLLVKLDPAQRDAALKKKGCREMDFSKRPAMGSVFVDPEGTDKEKDLEYWIDLALAFNKKAASN